MDSSPIFSIITITSDYYAIDVHNLQYTVVKMVIPCCSLIILLADPANDLLILSNHLNGNKMTDFENAYTLIIVYYYYYQIAMWYSSERN